MPPQTRSNPEHVFEDTEILVGARFVEGTPTAQEAWFAFTRIDQDGKRTDLPRLTVPLASEPGSGASEFSGTLRVPAVGATGDHYRLSYHFLYGEKDYVMGEEWVVWRQDLTLITKRVENGALTAKGGMCATIFTDGGKTQKALIPPAGELKVARLSPGPFRVELDAPYDFLKYIAPPGESGPTREIEYTQVPARARFLSPAGKPNGETDRSYVNDGGEKISFRIETASGPIAVGDTKVYVEVTFKNETPRSKGASTRGAGPGYWKERTVVGLANLTKSHPAGGRELREQTWKGDVTTGKDGTFTLDVFLGKGGGELCTIKIGTTKTVGDQTLTYESWRRLYVQYLHGDATAEDWGPAKRQPTLDAYNEVFIHLEMLPDQRLPDPLPPDMAVPAEFPLTGWYDGPDIGLPAGRKFLLNLEADATWENIGKRYVNPVSPLPPSASGIRVCLLAPDLTVKFGRAMAIGVKPLAALKASNVVEVAGTDANRYRKLPKGLAGQCSGKWEIEKNGVPKVIVAHGPIGPDAFVFENASRSDKGKMKVTIPPEGLTSLERLGADHTLYVDAHGYVDQGKPPVGLNQNSIIYLSPDDNLKELNNTVTHELGHSIGMVCDKFTLHPGPDKPEYTNRVPDYSDDFTEHPFAYTGRGSNGGHCGTGIDKKTFDKKQSLDAGSEFLTKFTCVIYAESQRRTTPVKYCEHCKLVLLAMDVYVGHKLAGS